MVGGSGHFSTPSILVVEDEADIATVLAAALRHAGYEVTVAGSGEEALGLFSGGHFDLALMDINLPGIDGFEAVERIRAGGSRTPILFLSAADRPEDQRAVAGLGARGLVRKPFSLESLLARVAAVTAPQ